MSATAAMPAGVRWKRLREDARSQLLGAARGWTMRRLRPRPISKADMISRERANVGASRVCHIIGSGWSLAESISVIDPEDYVVGYNLAGLAGLAFDSYHLERIDERAPGINEFYLELLRTLDARNLYIKNMYERNALPFVVQKFIDFGCMPYKTFNSGGYFVKSEVDALCEYLLEGGGPYLIQFKSTVLLLIVIYALVGFEEIVLHGQDLSGPYFFDVAPFPLAKTLDPRAAGVLPSTVPDYSFPHAIDQDFKNEAQITDVIPAMVDTLRRRKISLSCASAASPIAKYCPVYKRHTSPA